MLIAWNEEKFSLGLPSIDIQHRELFVLTNKLAETIQKKSTIQYDIFKRSTDSIIKNLYNYSSYHFLSEEQLFSEYSFPGAEEHIKKHGRFSEMIKNYLDDRKEKNTLSLEYLQDFLVEWIVNHIIEDDGKYCSFFKSGGVIKDISLTENDKQRNDYIVSWEEKKLSLNILEIDNQHRELINILQQTNDLQQTSIARKKLYIPIIIQKLIAYSQYHFTYEEEQMAKIDYEGLDVHREIHKSFIADINKFYMDYKNGSANLTDKLILFLKDWVVEHILGEDGKFKNALLAQKKSEV